MQSRGINMGLEELGLLKFEILTKGISVSTNAKRFLENSKRPIRTRSGSSGGLDIVLPYSIHVNAPINEVFASHSDLYLDSEQDQLIICRGDVTLTGANLQPIPEYYSLKTSDGVPMVKVGQMCSGDRFCYGMTGPYCWFWMPERRCKFCSIGLNKDSDASQKTIVQLLETLEHAINDPNIPAKHILIGGGTPAGEDMGALLASELCKRIKERFKISCYVMISAPLKNEYIDILKDSGADELGMNIEFYSDDAWKEFIPGKWNHISKKRYFDALEYSVKVIGSVNTRSIMIVGLEEPENTLAGVEKLASMGVMPILSPFRPLDGSILQNRQGFDYLTYWHIYQEAQKRISKYGMMLGPSCIPCQNNVLAIPTDDNFYKFY